MNQVSNLKEEVILDLNLNSNLEVICSFGLLRLARNASAPIATTRERPQRQRASVSWRERDKNPNVLRCARDEATEHSNLNQI